jgi:hypothetical protein
MTEPLVTAATYEQKLCLLVHTYFDRMSPMCGEVESRVLDQRIVTMHSWFRDELGRRAAQLELVYPVNHLADRSDDIGFAKTLSNYHGFCVENYKHFKTDDRQHHFMSFFLEAYQMIGGDVPGMGEKRLQRSIEVLALGMMQGRAKPAPVKPAAAAVLAKT